MKEKDKNLLWVKRLALIGTCGSWLVIMPAGFNQMTERGGELLHVRSDVLMMLSLSLAIIGFISAIEVQKDRPFKELTGLRGVTSLVMATCLVLSCLMIFVLCVLILLLTPDAWHGF